MMSRIATTAALLLAAIHANADEVRVLTWNVESSQGNRQTAEPATIMGQLVELQRDHGPFDLIGLTEVPGASAIMYATALQTPERTYAPVVSSTGGSDRMLITYDTERFQLVVKEDGLTSHNGQTFPGGNNRRPMFVTLDDRRTGKRLTFMVNHLNRGNDQTRRRQAVMLRQWVKDHPHPVIAVGDYNFDFDTLRLCGNQSMTLFMRDDPSDRGRFAWRWVIPGVETNVTDYRRKNEKVEVIGEFCDTNWSGDQRGRDRYPTSILDFVFLGGEAMSWGATSEIIVRDDDFPDDERTSDHRPVMAVVKP
ncbi:MAG: endonuclease/exonuclease/phosphatase family protein [Planctomycetota bacterium]